MSAPSGWDGKDLMPDYYPIPKYEVRVLHRTRYRVLGVYKRFCIAWLAAKWYLLWHLRVVDIVTTREK